MKKALVISSFPAPYRVDVFEALSKEYNLEVYFTSDKNDNRNSEWFRKSGDFSFQILNCKESVTNYNNALKRIKDYDFVLAYDPTEKAAIKAIILCRIKRVKYFVNCDGAIIRKNLIKDIIKNVLFRGATGCFSSGKSADDYFLNYGVLRQNIYRHKFSSLHERDILANPIEKAEKSRIKESLGLYDKFTFISVGQFIPRKGFDILLKAWENVSSEAQLLIIGGGDERKLYENMIDLLHLNNVVILDYMDKEALSGYYMASDAFVLATREDIWGLVVGEAMAYGLPVITTNMCMAGVEMIEDHRNGFIVTTEDENALSDKLNYICANINECLIMANNNISKIKDYTIERIAQDHIRTINSVL